MLFYSGNIVRARSALRACNKKRCRGAPVLGRSNKVAESLWPRTATLRILLYALNHWAGLD
jgi:hypothetical protein